MARTVRPKKTQPTKKADAILVGDIHATLRQPVCRTDDFVAAFFGKLDFLANLRREHGCPILQPGDMFDRWYLDKGEQWLLTELIKRVENWICIPGQHDLPQHNLSLYHKSSLALLEEAGRVRTLPHRTSVPLLTNAKAGLWVTGFPWGTEPTRDVAGHNRKRSIALIHRMTYPGKPPYPGAEKDGGTAKELMKKMGGFDLILSGDNHESFVLAQDEDGDYTGSGGGWNISAARILANPGSLMRTTAKQIDHEPCCFLWYADTNSIERVVIPHEKGAVSREHIDIKSNRDERIQNFVEHLEGEVDLDLSFEQNIERYMAENDTPEPVKNIVREVME